MKVLRRGLAFLLVFMMLVSMLSLTAFADETGLDVGFYEMASTASNYLSDTMARSGNAGAIKSATPASVGGFLGYSDSVDESNVISKWITSKVSVSSATFSYESLEKMNDLVAAGGLRSDRGYFYSYVKYGQLLNRIGFDQVGSQGSVGNIGRLIAGGGMFVMYSLCGLVYGIFGAVIAILKALNPFKFVNTGVVVGGTLGDGTRYSLDYDSGPIGNLLSNMYHWLSDYVGIFVIVFAFVFLAMRLLFMNLDRGRASASWPLVRKYMTRVFAIVIGVPLVASIYTSGLESLEHMTADNNAAGSRIVCSTFIDFETWAREMQLAAPTAVYSGGVGKAVFGYANYDDGTISASTYANLQNSCHNINSSAWSKAGYNTGITPVAMSTVNGDDKVAGSLISGNDAFKDTGSRAGATIKTNIVEDMLTRYMLSEFYYPSAWEVDAKAGKYVDDRLEGVIRDSTSGVDKFRSEIVGKDLFGSAGSDVFWGVSGSGSLGSGTDTFSNASGLSAMALYNYLSSEFGGNSLTVYSSEKASSGFVRKAHYSVNLIGGGVVGIFFYLNAFVLMMVMSVLAIFYAFSIIFSCIRRSFNMYAHIFGTAGGSLQSFAKLLTNAVVLLLEILGTMTAYLLASELLMALTELVTTPLLTAMSLMSGTGVSSGIAATLIGAFLGGIAACGAPVLIVTLLINIILLLVFMVTALKIRKDIVNSIQEIASSFIDKLVGVNHTHPTMSPGLMTRLGTAGAAGLGSGISNAMLSRAAGGSDGMAKGVEGMGADDTAPPDGSDPAVSDARGTAAGEDAGAGAGTEGGGGGGPGGNAQSYDEEASPELPDENGGVDPGEQPNGELAEAIAGAGGLEDVPSEDSSPVEPEEEKPVEAGQEQQAGVGMEEQPEKPVERLDDAERTDEDKTDTAPEVPEKDVSQDERKDLQKAQQKDPQEDKRDAKAPEVNNKDQKPEQVNKDQKPEQADKKREVKPEQANKSEEQAKKAVEASEKAKGFVKDAEAMGPEAAAAKLAATEAAKKLAEAKQNGVDQPDARKDVQPAEQPSDKPTEKDITTPESRVFDPNDPAMRALAEAAAPAKEDVQPVAPSVTDAATPSLGENGDRILTNTAENETNSELETDSESGGIEREQKVDSVENTAPGVAPAAKDTVPELSLDDVDENGRPIVNGDESSVEDKSETSPGVVPGPEASQIENAGINPGGLDMASQIRSPEAVDNEDKKDGPSVPAGGGAITEASGGGVNEATRAAAVQGGAARKVETPEVAAATFANGDEGPSPELNKSNGAVMQLDPTDTGVNVSGAPESTPTPRTIAAQDEVSGNGMDTVEQGGQNSDVKSEQTGMRSVQAGDQSRTDTKPNSQPGVQPNVSGEALSSVEQLSDNGGDGVSRVETPDQPTTTPETPQTEAPSSTDTREVAEGERQTIAQRLSEAAQQAAGKAKVLTDAMDTLTPAQRAALLTAVGTVAATSQNQGVAALGQGVVHATSDELVRKAMNAAGARIVPVTSKTKTTEKVENNTDVEDTTDASAELVTNRRQRRSSKKRNLQDNNQDTLNDI